MKLLGKRNAVRDAVCWAKRCSGEPPLAAALDPETATTENLQAYVRYTVGPSHCHECGEKTWDMVELGEPPDYESATASICLKCLRAAIELIEKGEP